MIPDEAINITNGIPSEIYVGIGRGRYVGEQGDYELAQDVAAAVRAECQTEIVRLEAGLPKTRDGVSIVCGMMVWVPILSGMARVESILLTRGGAWLIEVRVPGDDDEDGEFLHDDGDWCYSNSVAAEARGTERGDV